jgi:hypothetical protein
LSYCIQLTRSLGDSLIRSVDFATQFKFGAVAKLKRIRNAFATESS